MLDETYIEVGRIAVAFSLEDDEINNLVNTVGVFYGFSIFGHYQDIPIGQPYSYDFAYEWALSQINTAFQYDDFSDKKTWKQILDFLRFKESTIDYEEMGTSASNGFLNDNEERWKIFSANTIAQILRDVAYIRKQRALLYLYKCGMPFAKEVKGITSSLYESFVKQQGDFVFNDFTEDAQTIEQIGLWEKFSKEPGVNPTDKNRSLFVIEKWKGRGHADAYDLIKPKANLTKQQKVIYVSKILNGAKKLAVDGRLLPNKS